VGRLDQGQRAYAISPHIISHCLRLAVTSQLNKPPFPPPPPLPLPHPPPAALPPIHQGASWSLIYSTARDGISLNTLLRKAAAAAAPAATAAPCLLVVKDGSGAVFGAFTTEGWHVAPRFYGTGESFVFSVRGGVGGGPAGGVAVVLLLLGAGWGLVFRFGRCSWAASCFDVAVVLLVLGGVWFQVEVVWDCILL